MDGGTDWNCADHILDTVPMIMGALRRKMLGRRAMRFSMPQYRILAFLYRHRGASPSEVALHVGLMRPTTSKMIDGLVRHGWVGRQDDSRDRRRVHLRLTDKGMSRINATRHEMGASLAELLCVLSGRERSTVIRAMRILQAAFDGEDRAVGPNGRGGRKASGPQAAPPAGP